MPFVPAGTIAPGTKDSSGRDIGGQPYGGFEVDLVTCPLDGRVYANNEKGLAAHQQTFAHKDAAAKS